jgi:hypothetical protein
MPWGEGAWAAPVLAWAARTTPFSSSSQAPVAIPIFNGGGTALAFATDTASEDVVIIYNAECVVTGARGTWLSVSVFVDGVEANPASGVDFALCTAVDTDGKTYASVVRQAVFRVPQAGVHNITVQGRLQNGSGSWRLDDSSLVVQRARAAATRGAELQSTSVQAVTLPIKPAGGKVLAFETTKPNERIKFTYNAECVVSAADAAGRLLSVNFVLDEGQPATSSALCRSVDGAGETWLGAARQLALVVPEPGNHQLKVIAGINSPSGTWRVDDSSLAVTGSFLASASTFDGFSSSELEEVAVPLKPNGSTQLKFRTRTANQAVKLTFIAHCLVSSARGRWLGLRVEVDGVEAAPASSYDFALCSSHAPGSSRHQGFRQSVITIPSAGQHTARVFARISAGRGQAFWGLSEISLVVE